MRQRLCFLGASKIRFIIILGVSLIKGGGMELRSGTISNAEVPGTESSYLPPREVQIQELVSTNPTTTLLGSASCSQKFP